MAKIRFGGIAQDARGRIDGIVYSSNQYGGYVRTAVSPTQPQTARQTLVRERLTTLSKRFSTFITDAQRVAWNAFGKVNPVVDVFGQVQALTGIAAYVRLNGVLLNLGVAVIDTPPADLEVTGLLSMSVAMGAGLGTAAITFTDTPLPANHRLYIFATQGLNAGRQFFKPNLRFIGASGSAAVSPFAAGTLYTAKFGSMIAGTAVGWLVSVAEDTKGAVTPGIFFRAVVAA